MSLIYKHHIALDMLCGEWVKIRRRKTIWTSKSRYSEESIKLKRILHRWKAAQYDLAATYAFWGDKEKAYKYLDEVNKGNIFHYGG